MHKDLTPLAAEKVIFLDQAMECQGRDDERERESRYRMANMTLSRETI